MQSNSKATVSKPESCRRPLRRAGAAACALAAGLAFGLSAYPSRAVADYPDQSIRIVVPGSPGQGFDTLARLVAELLSKRYAPQAAFVENRPGAGGQIGQAYAIKQAADGYTLVAGGLAPVVLRPAIVRNLPVDGTKAFVPIAQLAEQTQLLIVKADSPYNSVQDILEVARAKPEFLKIGSHDFGSSSHMAYEMFAQQSDTRWLHAHFPAGPTQIVSGLLSDAIDVGITQLPPIQSMLSSGKLKALAVTNGSRDRLLPDVPTLAEVGFPGYDVSSWVSIHALAGTPDEIVEKLSRDIVESMNEPSVQERIATAGFTSSVLGHKEFSEKMEKERVHWGKLAESRNIKMDYKQR